MARARLTSQWDHTAPLLALVHDQNRMLKRLIGQKPGPAKPPSSFHPYRKAAPKPKVDQPKLPVTVLKGMFCKEA